MYNLGMSLTFTSPSVVNPKTSTPSAVALISPSSDMILMRDLGTADSAIPTNPVDTNCPGMMPMACVGSTLAVAVQAASGTVSGAVITVYGITKAGQFCQIPNRNGAWSVTLPTSLVAVEGGLFRSQFDPVNHAFDAQGFAFVWAQVTGAAAGASLMGWRM